MKANNLRFNSDVVANELQKPATRLQPQLIDNVSKFVNGILVLRDLALTTTYIKLTRIYLRFYLFFLNLQCNTIMRMGSYFKCSSHRLFVDEVYVKRRAKSDVTLGVF
ncbi:hypothetical protein TNIN_472411 [Trichonephila inaurata madagascariensis]|uniref:Uncharacterized protein n=1 Tax=Trichonephila inaurata madagascariensis TaxID=2747483 RepID=A0A8X7C2Q4_9ARAC|nr:hypothetical protein TNIN_472411 [Trichonephila inaurata madagascariensis]